MADWLRRLLAPPARWELSRKQWDELKQADKAKKRKPK